VTEQEAVETLAGLRKAFKALNTTKAVQAFNALLNNTGKVTSNFQLAGDFSGSLGTLRRVFDEMDSKRIQFPSN